MNKFFLKGLMLSLVMCSLVSSIDAYTIRVIREIGWSNTFQRLGDLKVRDDWTLLRLKEEIARAFNIPIWQQSLSCRSCYYFEYNYNNESLASLNIHEGDELCVNVIENLSGIILRDFETGRNVVGYLKGDSSYFHRTIMVVKLEIERIMDIPVEQQDVFREDKTILLDNETLDSRHAETGSTILLRVDRTRPYRSTIPICGSDLSDWTIEHEKKTIVKMHHIPTWQQGLQRIENSQEDSEPLGALNMNRENVRFDRRTDFPVHLIWLDGKRIKDIIVTGDKTIGQLKEAFLHRSRIGHHVEELITHKEELVIHNIDGVELFDEQVLKDVGIIGPETTLKVVLDPSRILIYFQITGRTDDAIIVHSFWTIRQLKEAVANKAGISVEQMQFIFDSRPLDDDDRVTIEDFWYNPGDVAPCTLISGSGI